MLRPGLQFGILAAALCLLTIGQAADVIDGRFELVDHTGQPVTEQSYDGKLRLVFFGFTRCPDVCPMTLLEVKQALSLLGTDAGQIQPLFISVDSEFDSPQQLAKYVAAFHPSLVGLTGSAEQIEAAAQSFNVTYGVNREAGAASDEIFHTSYLFLMDRQGKFVDVMGFGTRGERIAETVRDYL